MPPVPFLRETSGGTLLLVKLQPRASRNEICGPFGDALKIKVTAPPVDSAANQALIDFIAKKLDCSRNCIQIIRGQKTQHKTLNIINLNLTTVLERLKV